MGMGKCKGKDNGNCRGRTFRMAVNTPQAAKLRDVVYRKLSKYMGDYSDIVLAEYVVVLVCNGKHQFQAMEDLDAFLGDESGTFVAWLWDHLATNIHLYMASSQTLQPIEGNSNTDEKGKSNCESKKKRRSKEELRRFHKKPKMNAHIEVLTKRSHVSTLAHENSKAKHIKVLKTLQRRGCMGADNDLPVERREEQRLNISQYAHADYVEDENDQCADLKCSSHLKKQHSADFSSCTDHSVQDVHANKRISSSPHIVASLYPLQLVAREAVSPSGLSSSKRFESEIKCLRSVIVENSDAATDTVIVPRIKGPRTRPAPATAIARRPVQATAIATSVAGIAKEKGIARVRSVRSVWDRLGKPFDEELNGLKQDLDEHLRGFGEKQEMGNMILEQHDRDCEHGGWIGVHSPSGRVLSSRLNKDFTEDREMIENKNIFPTANSQGYGEMLEDVSARYMHAYTSSSSRNRQTGFKQAKHSLTKAIEKDHEESVTVEYSLAQTLNKNMRESGKHDTSSFGGANTSQKIVNISVNVNTWKQSHLESVKDAVDEEATVSSASQKRLQDQSEMSVDDSLPDKKEMGLREASEQITQGFNQNDVSNVRSRLHQVELEMAKLRAKQAKFCKDVPKPGTSTSGTQSPLLNSEEGVDSQTVVVSNVHFAATKETLSAHFNQCGEVLKVIVLNDVTSGQPHGSAYIMFSSKEAAEKALSLNNTSYMSRMLKVSLHHPPCPLRPMAKAAYARGSQYAFKKSSMYTGPQHFQWRRDGLTSGTSRNPDTSLSSFNSSPAVTSSVPALNGKSSALGSIHLTRSLTYIRAPVETLNKSPPV